MPLTGESFRAGQAMNSTPRRVSFGSFGNLPGLAKLGREAVQRHMAFARMVEEDNGDKEESGVYRKNVSAVTRHDCASLLGVCNARSPKAPWHCLAATGSSVHL